MKRLIVLAFACLFLVSLVSATELKLVKVSDLKVGDVIVTKAGVEVPVSTLVSVQSDKVTISDYIRQKIFGDKQEVKVDVEQVTGAGNAGQGVMSGNAILNLPEQNQTVVKISLWQKIMRWFGR